MFSWESDVFSLGCVLAEIFTQGQELFDLSGLLRYRSDDSALPTELLNRITNEKMKVKVV